MKRIILFITFSILSSFFLTTSVSAQSTIPLYGLFEMQVTNTNTYTNPFDFNEIEITTHFTAPSGKQTNFFGFYDGDGNGGQTGNVWKLRFMPDEVGTWDYSYSWVGTGTKPAGGSGSFTVTDTGLRGPLREASDNPWYFEDARGVPFDFRGYSLGWTPGFAPNRDITQQVNWVKNAIDTYIIADRYNFTEWGGLINRGRLTNEVNNWYQSWWLNTTDTKRFDIAAWNSYEEVQSYLAQNHIYDSSYAAFIYQGRQYNFTDFKVFLRYYIARLGAYYNLLGVSPTWEWMDIWSPTQVSEIMQYVYDIDPWKRPLAAHDCSHSSFAPWIGVTTRQAQSRTIFAGNSRTAGQKQGTCDGVVGGPSNLFINKPIIGSEDLWERTNGSYGQPRNETEVRRGGWGIMMSGVLPIYSEWNDDTKSISPGTGQGEDDVRRMFDFFYTKTQYRHYQQLNSLVSSAAQQIASGIPGTEYLVYDQDGGSITINLSGALATTTFTVLWYDPTNGTEQNGGTVNGGASRTLTSPYTADTVLFLTTGSAGPTLTITPTPTPTTTPVPTVPGDTDGDGDVDIFDYNAVITDFGKTGGQGFSAADFDIDGDVDIFDYNIVISNFGQ